MEQQTQSTQEAALAAFLKRIVPSGFVVTAYKPQTEDKIKQKVFQSHDRAAEFLLQMAWQKQDVWYAVASYKQGWYQDEAGTHKLRTKDNAKALKAFFYDIDIGEKHAYKDKTSATQALASFLNASGIPGPTMVVGSGNGLHVYWTIQEEIEPSRWVSIADGFKKAAAENNFKIDAGCTSDAARILRPIGTFNHKTSPPKPVTILASTPSDYPLSKLETAVSKWMDLLPARGRSVDNAELGGGIEHIRIPKLMPLILKRCGVMNSLHETHGKDCDEPEWKSVLQVLVHVEDGDKWIHSMSEGHPGYSYEATEAKYQQRVDANVGPTLCTTFKGYHPEKCAECPFRKEVKTPLSLGEDKKKYRTPDEIPYGYRYTEDGLGIEILDLIEEEDPGTGQKTKREIWVQAIPFGIYSPTMGMDEEYNHTCWFTVKYKGGSTEVSFPTADISNRRMLLAHINGKGIMVKPTFEKIFVGLMMDWLTSIKESKKTVQTVSKFGWNTIGGEECFTLADRTIFVGGKVSSGIHVDRQFGNVAKYYHPAGNIDDWKKAAEAVVSTGPELSVILASAFASPLLSMTELSGVMLSIMSKKSGVGKSTAMRTAQAVWGSPDGGINQLDDTEASITKKMGLLSNLPAYWDELRGDQALEHFGKSVFKLTGGKEKSRLRSDTTARDVGTWQTMLVAASNQSLRDYVANTSGLTDAGNLRVLEYAVETLNNPMKQSKAGNTFRKLKNNYGLAGIEYAEYLITHKEEIALDIERTRSALEKHLNAQHDERFWLAAIVILIVGAQIATNIGIVTFDMPALRDFLIKVFRMNRTEATITHDSHDGAVILADYLNESTRQRLIISHFPKSRRDASVRVQGGDPTSEAIAYVMSIEDKEMLVPINMMRNWLSKNRMALQKYSIEKELYETYGAKKEYRYIGAGVKGVTSSRTWCLILDMNHPDFQGVIDEYEK